MTAHHDFEVAAVASSFGDPTPSCVAAHLDVARLWSAMDTTDRKRVDPTERLGWWAAALLGRNEPDPQRTASLLLSAAREERRVDHPGPGAVWGTAPLVGITRGPTSRVTTTGSAGRRTGWDGIDWAAWVDQFGEDVSSWFAHWCLHHGYDPRSAQACWSVLRLAASSTG